MVSMDVNWADEVGKALTKESIYTSDSKAEFGNCLKISGVCRSEEAREVDILERSAFTLPYEKTDGHSSPPPLKPSYKEVLVGSPPTQTNSVEPPSRRCDALAAKNARLEKLRRGRRCFRCFASDHLVAACRDPSRCLACGKIGHRASKCSLLALGSAHSGVVASRPARVLDRMNRRRGRVHSSKAYIPYTEEFLRRVDMKRNALLVDVVQPADLGLVPHQTLADALARRFGGYPHDFFVTRYNDRDYAIFLPGWVSADTLIRRHLITQEDIWLRCYPWGPHRNARPHRSRFTAWIQLRNVPFECWTPARIASMICGFGRFIRADDTSKNMSDLRAYRCRIAVDDLREIPQRLAIVIGDEIVDIFVHLESSELVREGGVVNHRRRTFPTSLLVGAGITVGRGTARGGSPARKEAATEMMRPTPRSWTTIRSSR